MNLLPYCPPQGGRDVTPETKLTYHNATQNHIVVRTQCHIVVRVVCDILELLPITAAWHIRPQSQSISRLQEVFLYCALLNGPIILNALQWKIEEHTDNFM